MIVFTEILGDRLYLSERGDHPLLNAIRNSLRQYEAESPGAEMLGTIKETLT